MNTELEQKIADALSQYSQDNIPALAKILVKECIACHIREQQCQLQLDAVEIAGTSVERLTTAALDAIYDELNLAEIR